jgi:hypothetical protein
MPTSLPTARECAIRASLLLKAARSDDLARATAAAERFRILPSFAALAPTRIVAWRDSLRRKHALAVIAAELGFDSWVALLDACAATTGPVSMAWLFDAGKSVFLNHWCKTYEEASAIRRETDGFLFSYRDQYVVCTPELLADRGIDAYDPDWNRIGRDWVRPRDRRAFARLADRLTASGVMTDA